MMWIHSLRTRVTAFALTVALVPLIACSWYVASTSKAGMQATVTTVDNALSEQMTQAMLGQVGSKKATIEQYLENAAGQLKSFAESATVKSAMVDFRDDVRAMAAAGATVDEAGVKRYWRNTYGSSYRDQTGTVNTNIPEQLERLDSVALMMQHQYIAANEHPLGMKDLLDRAEGDYRYHETHENFHPWVRSMLRTFGYYDVFLVEPENGRVVYSVYKELDYGTSLFTGPWRQTGLARAFKKALALPEGQYWMEDYALFPPSFDAPATFVAQPVVRAGKTIGVAILQLPLDRISQTLSSRLGLGETGEVFAVGPDGLLRTDSLRFAEQYNVVHSFRNPDKMRIYSEAVSRALKGETGSAQYESYHGAPVFAAFTTVEALGKRWALVSEMEQSEALAKAAKIAEDSAIVVNSRVNNLMLGIILAVPVVVALALLFSTALTRPLTAITDALRAVAGGNLTVKLGDYGRCEYGQMADAFNKALAGVRHAIGSDSVDWSDDFGAMRHNLSRIQSMVEGAPSSLLMLDIQGTITYLNPAARRLLSSFPESLPSSLDALEGESMAFFFAHHDTLFEQLLDSATMPPVSHVEFADNVFSVAFAAIHDGAGEYLGPMLNLEVITEQLNHKRQADELHQRDLDSRAAQQRDIDVLLQGVNAAANGDLSLATPQITDPAIKQIVGALERLYQSLRESFQGISQNALSVSSAATRLADIGSQMDRNAQQASEEAGTVSH